MVQHFRTRSISIIISLSFEAFAFLQIDGCKDNETALCSGKRLFGLPNENTGLDETQCAPICDNCEGEPWSPPEYTETDFEYWHSLVLLDPPEPLTQSPYDIPPDIIVSDDSVCAVHLNDDGTYQLKDFSSKDEALLAGAIPTHFGICGLCSSLEDLAVYAETPDLTEPVRACGIEHYSDSVEELTSCIEDLGFTHSCATIWAYNTLNTRDECLNVCIQNINSPYNTENGDLNACLQCDEDNSGDVFKAFAGRTRRNTGLASSMCRPCEEVRPIEHVYEN